MLFLKLLKTSALFVLVSTILDLCNAFYREINCLFLILGEKGVGKSGKPLCYKGSIFHRIIKVCSIDFIDLCIVCSNIIVEFHDSRW